MPVQTTQEISEWVTCSPMNFRGCEVYANRDAGLVGHGFLANGLKSKSILLAPQRDSDLTNIIRATHEEMIDPLWWSNIAQHGVVFYNALKSCHSPILHAAKAAGLAIAVNVDSTGIADLRTNPKDFWHRALMHSSHLSMPRRVANACAGFIKNYYDRIKGSHLRFAAHLANADVIGGVTPDAVGRLRRFLVINGQVEAANRVHLIPHPTHPRFILERPKPTDGKLLFVTVGRWYDQAQKRPDLLMGVINILLQRDPSFHFRVFGKLIPEMQRWHSLLKPEDQARVELHGVAPNAELLEAYQSAHVYFCASAYESFLIAGAEAMCCGCSIVACDSPALPGPRWFASGARGSLSHALTAPALAEAAILEAKAWRQGLRDGNEIANWAQKQVHATQVSKSYASLLAQSSIKDT
jgi:glycosyltransferase involved in cell wall biosynthesis